MEKRKDKLILVLIIVAMWSGCIVVMAMMCNGNGILTCAG